MTLLISTFAAVIFTVLWYSCEMQKKLRFDVPMFIFWGASIMWFVDAAVEYAELGAEYFNQAPADILNDTFLGFSVLALGLIIWVVALLVTDPKGVIKNRIKNQNK